MKVAKAKRGSNGEFMSWIDIKMMYTWNVAQEIMRFHPPVFGKFRLTTRDISFGEFHIPKGCQLLRVASSTHMDETIFEDPDKIDPSRFDTPSKLSPRFTYIPFGAGPRICPGTEFARVESQLGIHNLITEYQWTEVIPDEPVTRAPIPYPAMGLPLKLEPENVKIEG
ncbi:cytochrome P450, putative [Ricinus communis]|uniref:Cytochrome P450, putative n=1 Tax=Ricinus communis TaxID=3988 RepID=B9S4E8_RICCO|nr:cytochrome P450, putative [Ricinus communis]